MVDSALSSVNLDLAHNLPGAGVSSHLSVLMGSCIDLENNGTYDSILAIAPSLYLRKLYLTGFQVAHGKSLPAHAFFSIG